MTVQIKNNSINDIDFLDIVIETFKTAPRKLFIKMMRFFINTIHNRANELEQKALSIDNMNQIPVDDLEEFYDEILENIDDIKFLKSKLEAVKNRDEIFLELLNEFNRVNEFAVLYMDRMGQLEVRILSKKYQNEN